MPRLRLGRDGWTGVAVLVLCVVLFGMTLGLKDNPLVPIGPGFYPRIIIALTAAFALLLVVLDVLAQRGDEAGGVAPARRNTLLVVLNFALFGVYALALPGLGFRIATLIYVAAATALLEPPRGAKGWARVLGLALVTTAVTYVLFEQYLSVLLPRGRWTDF